MALPMARPCQRSKNGTYWVRKVVPEPLRAAVGRREMKAPLGTRDPEIAKAKAREVLERPS